MIVLPFYNAHLYLLHQGLLDRVEQFLPMGAQQWEALALEYNRNLPANWPARDFESLRRKFHALKGVRKPTGNQPFDSTTLWPSSSTDARQHDVKIGKAVEEIVERSTVNTHD